MTTIKFAETVLMGNPESFYTAGAEGGTNYPVSSPDDGVSALAV